MVGNKSLNKIELISFVRCRVMSQAVSGQPPTVEDRVRAGPTHVRIVMDKVALGEVLLEYFGIPCQYHSTVVPYYLYTHLTRIRRTNSWSMEKPSEIREHWIENFCHFFNLSTVKIRAMSRHL